MGAAQSGPADENRPPIEWKRLGALAVAAQQGRRYRKPVSRFLYVTAAFNVTVTVGLATFAVRFDYPWSIVYAITAALAWSYGVYRVWMRREKPGTEFKDGFVYSRMLEAFTWTWISIVYIIFMVVICVGALAFRFRYSSLRGSINYMWCFPFFINLPVALGLDTVSSTAAFKQAAVQKGYPGAMFAHQGFYFRFVLLVINVVGVFIGWLFLFPPDRALSLQLPVDYAMYALYAQTIGYTLMLFYLLPRYANVCKHESAITTGKTGSRRFSRTGLARVQSMAYASDTIEAFMVEASDGTLVAADLAMHHLGGRVGEELSMRNALLLEMEDNAFFKLPGEQKGAGAHGTGDSNRTSTSGRSCIPAVHGVSDQEDAECDAPMEVCQLDDMLVPGQVPDLEAGVTPAPPRTGRRAAPRKSVSDGGLLLPIPEAAAQKQLPRRAATDADLAPRSNHSLASHSHRLSVQSTLLRSIGRRPSFKHDKACFGTHHNLSDAGTEKMFKQASMFLDASGGSSSGNLHGSRRRLSILRDVRHAGRLYSNPLVVIGRGLVALPRGLVELLVNVTAALRLLAAKWRWWAATVPHNFLFTAGFLNVGLITWPVSELPITSSVPAMVINLLALLTAVAIGYAVLFGGLMYADQAMILKEAGEDGSIGAGLIFSTSSVLNALQHGGPVEQSYVATEARLVRTAAISCRWDTDAAWMLHVRERCGGTRACQVMMTPTQLYRAALAAHQARCTYIWLDSLSVPQCDPADDAETAALKAIASRRLIPTMTAVYATVAQVLVVETASGLEDGDNAYNRRTWTFQEVMLNRNTACVHLDGRYTICGDAASRSALSGLVNDLVAQGMDDLGSYTWVLAGEEAAAVERTTREQRRAFPEFAASRSAARAADKSVALGQPFFKVFFEHVAVATEFMLGLAAALATDPADGQQPVLLIDNTGWDSAVMSGSGASSRFLMGRPSFMEGAPPSLWTIKRLAPPAASPAALQPESGDGEWWLCEVVVQGQRVPVALRPAGDLSQEPAAEGGLHAHLRGQLHQVRTCTDAERSRLAAKGAQFDTLHILWV